MVYAKCSKILDYSLSYSANSITTNYRIIIDSGKLTVFIDSGTASLNPQYDNGTSTYNLGLQTITSSGTTWDFSNYIKDNATQQISFANGSYPLNSIIGEMSTITSTNNNGSIVHGVTMSPYGGVGAYAFTWTEGSGRFAGYTFSNTIAPSAEIIVRGTYYGTEWVYGKLSLSRQGSNVFISGKFSGTENGETYYVSDYCTLDVYVSGTSVSSPVTLNTPTISSRSFNVGDSDVVISLRRRDVGLDSNSVFELSYSSNTWGGYVSDTTNSVLLMRRNRNSVGGALVNSLNLKLTGSSSYLCGEKYYLEWTTSTPNATDVVVQLQAKVDGAEYVNIKSSSANNGMYSYQIPEQCYSVQFRAYVKATNANAPTDGSVIYQYTSPWKESAVYYPEGNTESTEQGCGYVYINGEWHSVM